MTELSPIPAKGLAAKEWASFLLEQDDHLQEKINKRRERLKQLIRVASPSLVICYGSGKLWRPQFAKLLCVQWQEILPKTYVFTQSKQFLLLPFFGVGQMSTDVLQQLLDRGFLD